MKIQRWHSTVSQQEIVFASEINKFLRAESSPRDKISANPILPVTRD
jgi:hypothetical protein